MTPRKRNLKSEDGKPLKPTPMIEDITDNKKSEQKIRDSLKEREILLKEIHHRVKNNLQIVSSLLNLQAAYINDEKALKAFEESQNRIRTMALVHEELYKSGDFSMINFSEYIRHLTTFLFQSYNVKPDKIRLKLDVENVSLDINTAIPCGLIINELVSNSLKHGYPDGRSGEVSVTLKSENDFKTLIVKDNGVGIPEDLDINNTESLGMELVVTLTKQLGGNLELNRNGGTEFIITFE